MVILNKKIKIIKNSILLFILITIGILCFVKSYDYKKVHTYSFLENCSLEYNLLLKDNNFYESNLINGEDNKKYITDIIDKINLKFKYSFKLDKVKDININTRIIGKLLIKDNSTDKIYYEKDYLLYEDNFFNNNELINIPIMIDYNIYNDLSNNFRTTYGVEIDSNLIIYLVTNKTSQKVNFDSNKLLTGLSIPLSKKSINISRINNEKNINYVAENGRRRFIDNVYLFLFIIFIIISLFLLIKIIRLINIKKNNDSKYYKNLKKILLQYDRLIVEVRNKPNINNKHIINIYSFLELLDVKDNLHLPILHYSFLNKEEDYFYIIDDDIIFLYIMNSFGDSNAKE